MYYIFIIILVKTGASRYENFHIGNTINISTDTKPMHNKHSHIHKLSLSFFFTDFTEYLVRRSCCLIVFFFFY